MTIIRVKDTRNTSGDNTILTGSDLGSKRALDVRDIGQALVSPSNSSNSPLLDGTSFIGSWVERITPDMLISLKADSDLLLTIEMSSNASDIDYSYTFNYEDSSEFIKKLVISSQYWRVRLNNSSGSNATYTRLQTSVGSFADPQAIEQMRLGIDYDSLAVTYPTTSTESYAYSLGGSLVRTVLVTYSDDTKEQLTGVEIV